MFDMNLYARRIEVSLAQDPPAFARCRAVLLEAEEEWKNSLSPIRMDDQEKLDVPLAETGISLRTSNLIEKFSDALYIRDLVGVSREEMLMWPMVSEPMVAEIIEHLGPEFCKRYGIAMPSKEIRDELEDDDDAF